MPQDPLPGVFAEVVAAEAADSAPVMADDLLDLAAGPEPAPKPKTRKRNRNRKPQE